MHEEAEVWVPRQLEKHPSQAPSTRGLCLPEAWLFSSPHLHRGLGGREPG